MELLNKPLIIIIIIIIINYERHFKDPLANLDLFLCDLCAIIIPGFLKTGLAKKSTHSTT